MENKGNNNDNNNNDNNFCKRRTARRRQHLYGTQARPDDVPAEFLPQRTLSPLALLLGRFDLALAAVRTYHIPDIPRAIQPPDRFDDPCRDFLCRAGRFAHPPAL